MIGFALKSAFWLTIVLLLLPEFSGGESRSVADAGDAGAAATTSDALSFVAGAVADVASFCDRRQDACASGARFATSMGQRVRDGAMTLADLLERERIADGDAAPEASAAAATGTLNPADLELDWHAPAATKPPIE